MPGSNNSKAYSYAKRFKNLLAICTAAENLGYPITHAQAVRYFKSGKNVEEVSSLLWERLLKKQGPEIDTSLAGSRRRAHVTPSDRPSLMRALEEAAVLTGMDHRIAKILVTVRHATPSRIFPARYVPIVFKPGEATNWLVGIEAWKVDLAEEIYQAIESAHALQPAYDLISSPRTRKRLLRAIERGPVTLDEKLDLIEVRGLYPIVYRDSIDSSGKQPRDIVDYIKSRAWLRRFKGSKGGRNRQVPAEYCAVRMASVFEKRLGQPCWNWIAEIVDEEFPWLAIPTNASNAKETVNRRRRRWVKELAKRYARWAQRFRPKIQTAMRRHRRYASR